MDIEILNDILNTTISSLFLNKEKHINYFTRDDDNLNYPLDIQINNNKNMHLNNNQNKNYSESQYKNENFDNQYENIDENNLCTPELWIKTIGKKKFEDSLKKLNLDEKKINSKFLQNFSLQNLLIEKAKVKNELKKYDNDFKKVFKQMPSRNEKEIMKPLYIYYKTIKNNIEKKKNASVSNTVNPDNMNKNNNNMNINYNNVRIDKTNVNNNNNYLANNNLSNNNQKKTTMTNIYKNSNNLINNNLINTLIEKKDKKRKLTKEEMNILENEYYELKKEQNLLKNKLRNYQAEFTKINNRKVKFANDILPVKKEYDKYKANKTRIQEIKDLFSDPENRKDNNK